MTGSQVAALCGASLSQIVNQASFPDFCTKNGKWFRRRGELFHPDRWDETLRAKM
jgi:hypothetical protein